MVAPRKYRFHYLTRGKRNAKNRLGKRKIVPAVYSGGQFIQGDFSPSAENQWLLSLNVTNVLKALKMALGSIFLS